MVRHRDGCHDADAYYAADRRDGTLLCTTTAIAPADDPFFLPGPQDITAWVDFGAFARGPVPLSA